MSRRLSAHAESDLEHLQLPNSGFSEGGHDIKTPDDLIALLDFLVSMSNVIEHRDGPLFTMVGMEVHIPLEKRGPFNHVFHDRVKNMCKERLFNGLSFFSDDIPIDSTGNALIHFRSQEDASFEARTAPALAADDQRRAYTYGSTSRRDMTGTQGIIDAELKISNGTEQASHPGGDPRYTMRMVEQAVTKYNTLLREARTDEDKRMVALNITGVLFGLIMDRNTILVGDMEPYVAKSLLALTCVFFNDEQSAVQFLRTTDGIEVFNIPFPTPDDMNELFQQVARAPELGAVGYVAGTLAIAGATVQASGRASELSEPLSTLLTAVKDIGLPRFSLAGVHRALHSGAAAVSSPKGIALLTLFAVSTSIYKLLSSRVAPAVSRVEQQSRAVVQRATEASEEVSRTPGRVKHVFLMNERRVMFASMLRLKTKAVFPQFYKILKLRVRRGKSGNPFIGTPRGLRSPQESQGENPALRRLNVLANIEEEEEEEVEELLEDIPAEPRRLINISYEAQLLREKAEKDLLHELPPDIQITEEMIFERMEQIKDKQELRKVRKESKKARKESRKAKKESRKAKPRSEPDSPPRLRRRHSFEPEPLSPDIEDSQGTALDDSQGKNQKSRKPKLKKNTRRI